MSMNLPFEEQDLTPLDLGLTTPQMSGGVVVMGAVLGEHPNTFPALVFRFARHDGTGFYPPIVLGCGDVRDLERMPDLVRDAVHAAVRRAAP